MSQYQPRGLHLIADLFGIASVTLSDRTVLEKVLRRSAEEAGARILSSHFHQFGEGGGITGVLLLAESHISIHTWPEAGFAAVDLFMCGAARPQLALDWIEAGLAAASSSVQRISRGIDVE